MVRGAKERALAFLTAPRLRLSRMYTLAGRSPLARVRRFLRRRRVRSVRSDAPSASRFKCDVLELKHRRPHQLPSLRGRDLGRGAGCRTTPTQVFQKRVALVEKWGRTVGGPVDPSFVTDFKINFGGSCENFRVASDLIFGVVFRPPSARRVGTLGSVSDPKFGVVFRPQFWGRFPTLTPAPY